MTEQALHGSSFVNIPDEINQAYAGDLLRTSEAFAALLSNLFAFVKSGHPACPFITFMRTVLMSFGRGMEYGEQTLPTNDLFIYLSVQILPDLVVAMERQGYTPAEVKGGYGYRSKEEDADDNSLLVVGVHAKDIIYDRYPRMCRTRPGQKESVLVVPLTRLPSLLQLRLRIEVPLWRDLTTAKTPQCGPVCRRRL